jgi:hypothetical protein
MSHSAAALGGLLFLWLVLMGFIAGTWFGGKAIAPDTFHKGWVAGYAAHAQQTHENDMKLQAAGLCFYARLACPARKK